MLPPLQERLQGLPPAGAGLREPGGRGRLEGLLPQSRSLSRTRHGTTSGFFVAPDRPHALVYMLMNLGGTCKTSVVAIVDFIVNVVSMLWSLSCDTLVSFQCRHRSDPLAGEGRKGTLLFLLHLAEPSACVCEARRSSLLTAASSLCPISPSRRVTAATKTAPTT